MGAIAQMNFGRLLAPAGDPRVAEFVDALDKVNAIAERSPGFIWRLLTPVTGSAAPGVGQNADEDPLIAATLSVWEDAESFRFFVQKTLHGAFVKKRHHWFEPAQGPNYVIWPVERDARPTMAEARAKLADLATHGASPAAYDFKWLDMQGAAR